MGIRLGTGSTREGFTMEVESKGLRELERNLKRYGEKGERAAFLGKKVTALRIVTDAKLNVPVDEATLKNSIHMETEGRQVAVLTEVPYATRQEFEHSGRQARPGRPGQGPVEANPIPKKGFMRKAARKNRRYLVKDVQREFRRLDKRDLG